MSRCKPLCCYHDSLFLKSARSIFSSLKPILYLALVKNFFLSPTVTEGNFAESAKHWKKRHNKKESMCVRYMLQVKIISRLILNFLFVS